MPADVYQLFRELAPPLRHHAGALLRKPRNEQEMTEPPRRVVGKRQVRPNLSRTDFGYTERPRVPVQKAAKKVKRDEEEEGGATGASDRPARADKDSRSLTVDFKKLDMATLKRYKRHYRLKTRQNVTKTELALAVAKHFASQHVDEAETIQLFVYSARSSTLHYDRRDYLNGNGR